MTADPARGTRRRLQALRTLGWTVPDLAYLTEISVHRLRRISNHPGAVLTVLEVDTIHAAYQRLQDTPPRPRSPRHGLGITQARRSAQGRGWAPPAAWDDIDHDDHPQGVRKPGHVGGVDASEIVFLLECGLSVPDVADRLGVQPASIARRLRRHGQHRWAQICDRRLAC